MKLKKIIEIDKMYSKYTYFIDYVMTNDDVCFEDYNAFFDSYHFYYCLYLILECDEMKPSFSKEMHDRLGKLIDYIKQNPKVGEGMLKSTFTKYDAVKENNSYDFYNNELLFKYDTIDSKLENSAIVWSKKDIEEAVKIDFDIRMSLDLDEDTFKKTALPTYALNQNYLLFLKKLLKTYSSILLDNKYRERILLILEYNNKIIEYSTDNETIKEFIDEKFKHITYENRNQVYEKFVDLNNDIYNKVSNINKDNYCSSFTIDEFESIYFKNVFEYMIVQDEKCDINYSNSELIEYLYELIKKYDECNLCNKGMQTNIIKIMDKFLQNYKGDKKEILPRYNHYLGIVNSMELNEYAFRKYYFVEKAGVLKSMTLNKNPYLIQTIMDTMEVDVNFLNYILDDTDEEKYMWYFSNENYYFTLKKIFEYYPYIFTNKDIYEKTLKIFKAIESDTIKSQVSHGTILKDTKCLIKKINKLYYEKR